MPKTLFKYIIHKKYKDEIPSILLFHKRIDFLFKTKKISEEEKLNLIQLFNKKNNLWLKILKFLMKIC